jgi:hypothetical protein
MARRVPQAPPAAESVDREVTARRARRLEMRLRVCVPQDGDLYRKIQKATDAAKELEPAERLAALLDLADELRPVLPAGVVKYTLPTWFNGWRP